MKSYSYVDAVAVNVFDLMPDDAVYGILIHKPILSESFPSV
jgi:hypothetical protein